MRTGRRRGAGGRRQGNRRNNSGNSGYCRVAVLWHGTDSGIGIGLDRASWIVAFSLMFNAGPRLCLIAWCRYWKVRSSHKGSVRQSASTGFRWFDSRASSLKLTVRCLWVSTGYLSLGASRAMWRGPRQSAPCTARAQLRIS